MRRLLEYQNKYESLKNYKLYTSLSSEDRQFIDLVSLKYRITKQEFEIVVKAARDFEMWKEISFERFWQDLEQDNLIPIAIKERKKKLFKNLNVRLLSIKKAMTHYGDEKLPSPKRKALKVVKTPSSKTIFGDCPVASEKTVCCNLKTVDAVENCAFGCSYCTIQTFYGDEVVFDTNLKDKLDGIKLDPNRYYHFGTGQSSDSLVWGNKEGVLDSLCDFARRNPNILLEFKTKSSNVAYFLKNESPRNIVCSWTMNSQTIIENEEHLTASLDERLQAARKVADSGVKVAFHFHPMVHYDSWQEDYSKLAERVLQLFDPEEVLFVSFGTLTFIKPVIQQIRLRGEASRILQMDMVKDPHGKLTYSDEIKLKLFATMHTALKEWHSKVYMYLCMERAEIWDALFGSHYETNDLFEAHFGEQVFEKIDRCFPTLAC